MNYALITGGGSGLGYHFSRELAKRGYKVIIVSRDEVKLKRVANELKGYYFAIDLSRNYRDLGKIIEDYEPKVVINNAGFGLYGYFPQQDFDSVERMINLNITALTYITHKTIKTLGEREGYILNVSSLAACHPLPKLSVYAATKAYVEHLTRSLQGEVPPNIHLAYLLLGPTRTDFFRNAGMNAEKYERFFLNPEKVAKYAIKKLFAGKRRILPFFPFRFYCLCR